MSTRPVVMILLGAFWPKSESTGPNHSIKGMCEALSSKFEFRIIARDRPFGADGSIVASGTWIDLGYAKASYLPIGALGAKGLWHLLRKTQHDVLILNGFFDREFTIPALFFRRFGGKGPVPTILSPRGEFSSGALGLKNARKHIYLAAARALSLLRGVYLHATSEAELNDITRELPGGDITLAANVRSLPPPVPFVPRAAGAPLRAVFVGRISPVKGVHTAIEILARTQRPITYDIYGPVSDAPYWEQCKAAIARLPSSVDVQYKGEIPNSRMMEVLAAHDILLLPSKSENFGHAIFESLSAGTPVVIGDATPWRALSALRAGFDLPLDDLNGLAHALEMLADMDVETLTSWRKATRKFLEHEVAQSHAAEALVSLISKALGPQYQGRPQLSERRAINEGTA